MPITKEDIDNMEIHVRIHEEKHKRAYVDVVLCNFMYIKDFMICENKQGKLYVINPQKKMWLRNEEGKTFPKVYGTLCLINHPLRDYFCSKIIREYGKHFQERERDNRMILEEMNYEYKAEKKVLDKKF